MKDRIITFIMILIIILILGVIGTIGYKVYTEINEQGTIILDFKGDKGLPTIQFIPNNTIDISDDELFFGSEDKTETNNQTEVKNSRHLYNQLDKPAKIFYKKLYENRDNLKTGTYEIQFGNTFQSTLAEENGEVKLKSQYQSAIEALVYENPDIFYLDVTKMYINIEKITKITGVKYNVYINNGNESSYLADGFFSKEDIEEYEVQIENAKNTILSRVKGKTDYQKIKEIHDYLIDTIEYENDLNKDNIYNIYGALVEKRCVCEGYAKAFQYLMNEIGIENTIVIGVASNSKNETENHAWNYIKLNEKWYAVDVTWDDPILTGGGKLTNKSRYKYFLKGFNTMNENHVSSGKFTEEGRVFEYPQLSIKDFE